MVKGISRQVIVVPSTREGLFEQAIFILKDNAPGQGITGEALMKEAEGIVRNGSKPARRGHGALWALGGAAVTGLIWLITAVI